MNNKLKSIDYAIYVYIENNNLCTAKSISIGLKVDKAVIYKRLNMLLKNNNIICTNENPKRFNII